MRLEICTNEVYKSIYCSKKLFAGIRIPCRKLKEVYENDVADLK